ncbi:MAG: hypothetical protein HYT96_05495, partial [Armatimonadetes bacterium]|nr:hypothetical protein [Armatimonadota bacterium]
MIPAMRTLLLTAWLGAVWLRPFVAEAVTPHLHWFVQLALIGLSLWLCWSLPAPSQPSPRGLSLALGGWLIVSVLALLPAARVTLAVTTWLQVVAPAVLVPVIWRLEARRVRQLLLALCL